MRAAAFSSAGPILQASELPITTALLYSEVTETICRLPEITLSYEAKRYERWAPVAVYVRLELKRGNGAEAPPPSVHLIFRAPTIFMENLKGFKLFSKIPCSSLNEINSKHVERGGSRVAPRRACL